MEPGPPFERRAAGAPSSRRRTLLTVVMLLIPVVAALAVPAYARATPRLGGVPFFYWFQGGCVLLTVVCLGTALVLSRDGERPANRERAQW